MNGFSLCLCIVVGATIFTDVVIGQLLARLKWI